MSFTFTAFDVSYFVYKVPRLRFLFGIRSSGSRTERETLKAPSFNRHLWFVEIN